MAQPCLPGGRTLEIGSGGRAKVQRYVLSMYQYSRATLNKCYNTLYGNNPPSAWRKVDVVRGIQKMKRGIDRAKAMKP